MIRIELISPPDREELVAALLVDHSQFAEIRIEGGDSKLQFGDCEEACPPLIRDISLLP